MGTPVPQIKDNAIIVKSLPSEQEFRGWAEGLDRHIADTNHHYANVVLTERRQREEAARVAEEHRRRVLEDAQGWAAKLEPPEE